VALVVSSKASALGLKRAKRVGVATFVLEYFHANNSSLVGNHSSQAQKISINWAKLQEVLNEFGVTHIFLLGFMKLLPADWLERWQGRIWNVHPSLLPAYPGLHSIEKAMADGAPLGVTVHDVIAVMDEGQVRLQKSLGRFPPQTPFAQARLAVGRLEQQLIQSWVRTVEARSLWDLASRADLLGESQ
jgi:phosphoribosylglycinamide formyltransferase-1